MLTCAHVVRVASARCQVMPSDTASAAWSAQMSAGIPWSLRGSMPGAGCHCACRLRVCLCCAPLSHMGTRGARVSPQSAQGRGDPSALWRVPLALARSECGCVLWWSVPVGPTWVRVQPPHVPKRGMRPHAALASRGCIPCVDRASRHGTARWACTIGADQTDVPPVLACADREPWACQRLGVRTRWCRGGVLLNGSTRSAAMVCASGVAIRAVCAV